MSELMNACHREKSFRTGLLATVSSAALLGYICITGDAALASAGDDRPTVWIELGGQTEHISDTPELFSPAFFSKASPADSSVLAASQKFPPYSTGLEGKISFQPEGSDWVLSAAIRYGRSGTIRHLHHQTAGLPTYHDTFNGYSRTLTPAKVMYADTHSGFRESHTVLDFQVGKDVGLGLLGAHRDSTFKAGVRFAQFSADSHTTLHARPTYGFGPPIVNPGKYKLYVPTSATYTGVVHSSRHTRAVGPSLSWDASLPVTESDSNVTLNLDWGVNVAVLFGRQRANVHHQTNGYYLKGFPSLVKYSHRYTKQPPDQARSRFATIPNVGGFAGVSLKFPNAKASIGYRADFFFGAMDGGIDAARKENVGFYGPFASVSIGLGG